MSALVSAIPFPTRPTGTAGARVGYPHPALACGCEHPLRDMAEPDHCYRCGHESASVISGTFEQQALRTRTAGRRLAVFDSVA